jgi:hypothetical protein
LVRRCKLTCPKEKDVRTFWSDGILSGVALGLNDLPAILKRVSFRLSPPKEKPGQLISAQLVVAPDGSKHAAERPYA